MKSYIVPNLDNNDKQMLHDHGVVYFPWNNDIMIDPTQLEHVLQLLGATATEQATEFEGMFLLTLAFNAAPISRQPKNTGSRFNMAHAASRARYIEICSARLGELARQAQAKVIERKQKLAPAQESFIKASRSHFVTTTQSSEAALKANFAEQFDRLASVEKVKAVRVTNGAVLVYTDCLFARDPRTKLLHELGSFLIIIRTDGSEDGVRWYNSTRRVRTIQPGMNAPRVFADGTACIDEIKETLLELIAQFEFATVAELAIQFVENVADDELSKFIDKWPPARG